MRAKEFKTGSQVDTTYCARTQNIFCIKRKKKR